MKNSPFSSGFSVKTPGLLALKSALSPYLLLGLRNNSLRHYRKNTIPSTLLSLALLALSCLPSYAQAVQGNGDGLKANYRNGTDAARSNIIFTRTDAKIDFNWGLGSPASSVPRDRFSVNWQGEIQPRYTGEYTFYGTSDDGNVVLINGQTVVSDPNPHAVRTATGKITLEAGKRYPITVYFYEDTGSASMKLEWSSAKQSREVVPTSQLYSGAAAAPVVQTPPPAQSATINSVDAIINDMTGEPDGRLHGVPTNYSWASCKGAVDDPTDSRGFRAATAWGQLYEDARGNPATNTRVQIRYIKTYVLSKRDNAWHLAQSSKNVSGAAFIEDFSNNTSKPADIRTEADGFMSVTAGGGYNFHFWPDTFRAAIDPADMGGIFTTVQARVIGPDSAQARYLLNMGGDWWLDQTAAWDNFKTNGGIGGGRCKAVKPEWQSFNMTTLSPDAIRKNPPPLD